MLVQPWRFQNIDQIGRVLGMRRHKEHFVGGIRVQKLYAHSQALSSDPEVPDANVDVANHHI